MCAVRMLVGYPGSGKDYLGSRMIGFTRLAFADSLKEEVSSLYTVPLRYFHERELKDTYYDSIQMTPRILLIQHATMQRSIDTNHFVKALIQKIQLSCVDAKWVITDCRFYNEIYVFKKTFGDRVSIVWIEREAVEKQGDSIEVMKQDCDTIIYNC